MKLCELTCDGVVVVYLEDFDSDRGNTRKKR